MRRSSVLSTTMNRRGPSWSPNPVSHRIAAMPSCCALADGERPNLLHCLWMFGDMIRWPVPERLKRTKQSCKHYKKWYRQRWIQQRRQLASQGNIAACLSIRRQQAKANALQRRQRLWRKTLAQQISLHENANPWGALAILEAEDLRLNVAQNVD